MELFPDGGFVRLQSRANGKYIHADGDWRDVSLRPLSHVPSLEAVWRVEHCSHKGERYVLLQNAAYGRYLSFAHRRSWGDSHRVIQRDYDDPNLVEAFLWSLTAERVYPDQDHVRLHHRRYHLLAKGGRHLTWWWDTRATANHNRHWHWFRHDPFIRMQWTVHAVAATPIPLDLPITQAFPPRVPLNIRWRRSQFFWYLWRILGYGPGVYENVPREYRHVRANAQGNFEENQWRSFIARDLPVVDLRRHLANLQEDSTRNVLDFTMCIKAGSHGRLMPLVTHLPRSGDPLNIVVLRTGSQAANALVYPQIAPAP